MVLPHSQICTHSRYQRPLTFTLGPCYDTACMHVRIASSPAYAIAYITLNAGEFVYLEKGSMVAMSGGISVVAGAQGGLLAAGVRAVFADEQLFQGRYEASITGAWVAAAPAYPGDVMQVDIANTGPLTLQSGAYLAHGGELRVDTGVGDLHTLLMKEGLFTINTSGTGIVLLSSYGGIEQFELARGQSLIVDTGHLVAWSTHITMRTGILGGVVAGTLAGEGLVTEIIGPGTVYIQSRAEKSMRNWINAPRGQNVKM